MAAAILALFVLTFARVYLDLKFRRSLRREAPQVFEKLVGSRARGAFLSRAPIETMRMMLLRSYRTQLADYPVSRAWASWISFVDWALIALAAAFMVAALVDAG